MKLSHRTVLAGTVAAIVLGVACWSAVTAGNAGTSDAVVVTGGCPRHLKLGATFEPVRMIPLFRALKAQIPRVFRNLSSMGDPAWPHANVQALVRLDQLPLSGFQGTRPPVRGLDQYVRFAARACGKKTALSSVLVFIQFPLCQIPCSFGWAYLTPTRAGWRLWTSYTL
jgi:hypothetical protein